MTKDDINNMPSGIDLDILVMQYVFGMRREKNHGFGGGCYWVGNGISFWEQSANDVTEYSTDIVSAWKIDKPNWTWDFSESSLGLYINLYIFDSNGIELEGYSSVVSWESVDNNKTQAYCLGRCRTALLSTLDG